MYTYTRQTSVFYSNNLANYTCFHSVKSLLELVPYRFLIPGVKVLLTERLCQDPLEKFFWCHRQRGGTHDNPTVQEFYQNTCALRVVNSFCVGSVKGNCCAAQEPKDLEWENAPLPKWPRATKKTLPSPLIPWYSNYYNCCIWCFDVVVYYLHIKKGMIRVTVVESTLNIVDLTNFFPIAWHTYPVAYLRPLSLSYVRSRLSCWVVDSWTGKCCLISCLKMWSITNW